MIPIDDILNDPRIQVLLTAARHAHATLVECSQQRVAENLDFALKPFESDDRLTIPPAPGMEQI